MRSRRNVFIAAVLAAVALAVGVTAVAVAGRAEPLPAVSAADLLAKIAQRPAGGTSISGDIAWENTLLGDAAALANSTFGDAAASLPLAGSGSGRVWLDAAAGLRLESQANGGDRIFVASASRRDAWVYDHAARSARHLILKGEPAAGAPSATPLPEASVATPAGINRLLQWLAPRAALAVTGQGTLGGRSVYFLTVEPKAAGTALAAVRVSVDGTTYVPLRLEVFAKGVEAPVLSFGFTRVSYGAVPAETFVFSPPKGTEVTTEVVDVAAVSRRLESMPGRLPGHGASPDPAEKAAAAKALRGAVLSVAQARELVPFELHAAPASAPRPFAGALVADGRGPLNALGEPLAAVLGGSVTAPLPSAARAERTAVLVYGDGLGAIVLAQTRATPDLEQQIAALPAPLEATRVGGAAARSLTTPLGGVYVWRLGETVLVAAGMVPAADLRSFVAAVR